MKIRNIFFDLFIIVIMMLAFGISNSHYANGNLPLDMSSYNHLSTNINNNYNCQYYVYYDNHLLKLYQLDNVLICGIKQFCGNFYYDNLKAYSIKNGLNDAYNKCYKDEKLSSTNFQQKSGSVSSNECKKLYYFTVEFLRIKKLNCESKFFCDSKIPKYYKTFTDENECNKALKAYIKNYSEKCFEGYKITKTQVPDKYVCSQIKICGSQSKTESYYKDYKTCKAKADSLNNKKSPTEEVKGFFKKIFGSVLG